MINVTPESILSNLKYKMENPPSSIKIAIQEGVEKALLKSGYDIDKPFIRALIASHKFEVDAKDEKVDMEVVSDFKNKEIVTKWTNKDGGNYEVKIDSTQIVKNMLQGRSPYTIKPKNNKHKHIAFSRDGHPYNASDKSNVVLLNVDEGVDIPAKPGVKFDELGAAYGQLEANKWVDKVSRETLEEVKQLLKQSGRLA